MLIFILSFKVLVFPKTQESAFEEFDRKKCINNVKICATTCVNKFYIMTILHISNITKCSKVVLGIKVFKYINNLYMMLHD